MFNIEKYNIGIKLKKNCMFIKKILQKGKKKKGNIFNKIIFEKKKKQKK